MARRETLPWCFAAMAATVLGARDAGAQQPRPQAKQVAGDAPAPRAPPTPEPLIRRPFCFAVAGNDCALTVAVELAMGTGVNLHGGSLQIVGRGHVSLGFRAAVAPRLRVGPVLDVGYDIAGNEENETVLGWYALPKASFAVIMGDGGWSLLGAVGPSFLRSFHRLEIDTRVGAVFETGIGFGQGAVIVANETIFDLGGPDPPQVRAHMFLRGSACGLASGLSRGGLQCH